MTEEINKQESNADGSEEKHDEQIAGEDSSDILRKERDELIEEYKDKDLDLDAILKDETKPKEELPAPSQERFDSIRGQGEQLYEKLDIKKVSDTDYIYDIFDPNEKYKSLSFIKNTKKNMLEKGYIDSPFLDNFLFWAAISRRLQIKYQQMQFALEQEKKTGLRSDISEDIPLLEQIQKITDKLHNMQKILDAQLIHGRQDRDVVDMHMETLKEAEKYLQDHWGEFSTIDPDGNILTTDAKAHWAFAQMFDEKNDVQYHVWSEELIYLFKKGIIPIEIVCFALRTSPEGIKWVAKKRGEKLPEFDIKVAEKTLKKYMIEIEENSGK